jgi:hypothetical protein
LLTLPGHAFYWLQLVSPPDVGLPDDRPPEAGSLGAGSPAAERSDAAPADVPDPMETS